jgi:hypothetical protein
MIIVQASKDKVVPEFNYLSTMPRRQWGRGVTVPPFLTSVLHGDKWSTSCPGRLTHGEKAPCTHWIGGLVGPRVSLDAVEKRKIFHFWESNLGRPAHILLLYWLSYPNPVAVATWTWGLWVCQQIMHKLASLCLLVQNLRKIVICVCFGFLVLLQIWFSMYQLDGRGVCIFV